MKKFEEIHTRRNFLGTLVKTGAGAVAAQTILSSSVLAITGNDTTLATVDLSKYKDDLVKPGDNVLIKDTPAGDLLIVKLDGEKYSVLSNICPHKQCKVKVKSASKIECPCHRSSYAIDGTYQHGPAKKDLKSFTYKLKDNTLTITKK